MSTTREYTSGEITVIWKPEMCIHSKKCFHGLPAVFDPSARPWVNINGAKTEDIRRQVEQCPSGALSYHLKGATHEPVPASSGLVVEVMSDGPLVLQGEIICRLPDGSQVQRSGKTSLCRCGFSSNKPFCDGSHIARQFKG